MVLHTADTYEWTQVPTALCMTKWQVRYGDGVEDDIVYDDDAVCTEVHDVIFATYFILYHKHDHKKVCSKLYCIVFAFVVADKWCHLI